MMLPAASVTACLLPCADVKTSIVYCHLISTDATIYQVCHFSVERLQARCSSPFASPASDFDPVSPFSVDRSTAYRQISCSPCPVTASPAEAEGDFVILLAEGYLFPCRHVKRCIPACSARLCSVSVQAARAYAGLYAAAC